MHALSTGGARLIRVTEVHRIQRRQGLEGAPFAVGGLVRGQSADAEFPREVVLPWNL